MRQHYSTVKLGSFHTCTTQIERAKYGEIFRMHKQQHSKLNEIYEIHMHIADEYTWPKNERENKRAHFGRTMGKYLLCLCRLGAC